MALLVKEKNKSKTTEPVTLEARKYLQLAKEKVYETEQLNLWYGDTHALKDINLAIYKNEITAIIGPSYKSSKSNG